MFEIRHLRHFVAVVEAGGFRPAARATQLSPAALLRSVQVLEEACGVRLLDRDARSVRPTAHGRQLLHDARGVVRAHAAIPGKLRELSELVRGELRVGVSPALVDLCLDRVFATLLDRHPRVELTVEVDTANILLEALDTNRLDAVVAYARPLEEHGGIHVEALYDEEVAWWVRREHPLAKTARPRLAALTEYPVITQPLPSPFSDWFSEVRLAAQPGQGEARPVTRALQCMDYGLLLHVAAMTDAIALVPVQNVLASPASERLRRLALPRPPPRVRMAAGWLRDVSPSPLTSAFLDVLRAVLADSLCPTT